MRKTEMKCISLDHARVFLGKTNMSEMTFKNTLRRNGACPASKRGRYGYTMYSWEDLKLYCNIACDGRAKATLYTHVEDYKLIIDAYVNSDAYETERLFEKLKDAYGMNRDGIILLGLKALDKRLRRRK